MPADELVSLDALFRDAISAIDAGDIAEVERLLAAHPELVRERLAVPGAWLRDTVGEALDGFFQRPYLLWFVAEDPVRNGTLPANIAAVARTIIDAARRDAVPTLQEQLDYALELVSWSWIARECGLQIDLIDVLVDAGARADGNPNNALVNGNVAAAEHLVKRGATVTLAAALCLGRWDDVERLVSVATESQKRFAFVLSALNGKVDALRRLVRAGVDVDAPSTDLYSHATPLHHAVCSGSLDAVQVLVDAGAALDTKDSAWGGTPLGWAEHYVREGKAGRGGDQYADIAAYLRRAAEASARHTPGDPGQMTTTSSLSSNRTDLPDAWLRAWNSHDLDAIMSHYADDVTLVSPTAATMLGEPSGEVRGKAAVRAYFQKGLDAYPALRFEMLDIMWGVRSVVVCFVNQKGTKTAEFMELDAGGQIARVVANYSA